MKSYLEMTKEELEALREELSAKYEEEKAKGYSFDMSRGKPSPNQLTLSMEMFRNNDTQHWQSEDGTDCRNYGAFDGIPEAKRLMAWMMDCREDQVIMGGNSSLSMMYDCVVRAMMFGILGSRPWKDYEKISFLCPVPGYDRHFRICEQMGINMINVPMTPAGPDMDIVEKAVAEDESIKGIWCVPKYSNPQGISYSDETVRRFARLKPKAKDFRIFWDNAYGMHHLYDHQQDHIIEILAECKRAGNPDLVYKFASTSKITFPGSGIASLATSPNNMVDFTTSLRIQTLGHDKVNQLRHTRFFRNIHGMVEHMRKHADIIRPKFEMVEDTLEKDLGDLGVGTWTKPLGGYFIMFDSLPGCAKDIVARAKKAGVILTPAGSTWPYGNDINDSNIRIAPTFPSISELKKAMDVFTVCVRISSIHKLLDVQEG